MSRGTLYRLVPALLLPPALAVLWLSASARDAAVDAAGRPLLPDFYVEQPHWQLFDRSGRLERELRARRLEQWPDDDRARLVEPRLQVTDGRQQRWQAGARRGWVPPEHDRMVLEGGVRFHREPENGGPVVTTEQLRIGAKGDLIETDHPVALVSGSWHFTAAGLHADLGRQQLQLLGNVRGIHD